MMKGVKAQQPKVSKVCSCPFLAWISLLLVASFQLVHIYNLETTGALSLAKNTNRQRFSRRSVSTISEVLSSQNEKRSIASKRGEIAATQTEIEEPMQSSSPSLSAKTVLTHLPIQSEQSAPQLTQFTWNKTKDSTCQVWPKQSHQDPTGLVVTLVLTPDEPRYLKTMRTLLCNALPSQMTHLLGPQKWDLLLVISGEHFRKELSHEHLVDCLNLTRITDNHDATDNSNRRVWQNLDGTKLTTVEYRWQNRISVFLSEEYHIQWPQYIQNNQSILSDVIDPPVCNAPKSYIQGTRWYTHEMLNLQILQDYHYFIKLDLDLFFHKTPQWHLLHDLQTRNALFAHTAALPKGGGRACTTGIVNAVRNFASSTPEHQHDFPLQYCGHNEPLLRKDRDWFYTNFIIGRVDFWTQPLMLQLGRYLSECESGFFRHRWTDQVMWPQALGLLVGLHFGEANSIVADYTELRCSVETNCWNAVFYTKLYGDDAFNVCPNGGYFRHTKNPHLDWRNESISVALRKDEETASSLWKSDKDYYETKYKDECKTRLKQKREAYKEKNGDEMKHMAEMIKQIPPGFIGK